MNEDKLKLLGLNSYEIKALMTLLYKGKSKASFISQDSSVPYGKIYDTLASLEEKGLIAIVPEDVKYFVAKPIKYLKELLKEKQKELLQLDKDLDSLKNIEEERVEGEIMIVRGKKNFHKIIKEMDKADKYSYTIKWLADVKDMNFQKSTKDANKRGVRQLVMYDNNAPKENIKHWEKLAPKYKFIESEGIALSTNETNTFISILELNSTILIKSKKFSKLIKQLYEGYYNFH